MRRAAFGGGRRGEERSTAGYVAYEGLMLAVMLAAVSVYYVFATKVVDGGLFKTE